MERPGQPVTMGDSGTFTATVEPQGATIRPSTWSGATTGAVDMPANAAFARASAESSTAVIGLDVRCPSTAPTTVTCLDPIVHWASKRKHPPAAASVPVLMPTIPS